MICGEPLYWIYYNGNFVGCIFYIYHQYTPNEYKFICDSDSLRGWLKENENNYTINKEFQVDLLDTSHEDYDIVISTIKKNRNDHLDIR